MGVAGRNVKPSVCPFKYIKISGQVYQRNTGNIYDDEYDYKGVYCHDCSVLYGNTHHIQCDMERCSKCEKQLLGCGHLIGVKFHRGPADKGIDSDVPINQLVAERFRHRLGEIKLPYDSWLKSCISNYLEFEDTHRTKAKPEYQSMLTVLRNILHCMGAKHEQGDNCSKTLQTLEKSKHSEVILARWTESPKPDTSNKLKLATDANLAIERLIALVTGKTLRCSLAFEKEDIDSKHSRDNILAIVKAIGDTRGLTGFDQNLSALAHLIRVTQEIIDDVSAVYEMQEDIVRP